MLGPAVSGVQAPTSAVKQLETPGNGNEALKSHDPIERPSEIGFACSVEPAPGSLKPQGTSASKQLPAPVVSADMPVPRPLLLGPGPTNFRAEVLSALSNPPMGYMDPRMLQVLAEIQELLRYVFQTKNAATLAVSGTGSAAMEMALSNLIEAGDVVLVPSCGYFGHRIAEMARRYGADVRVVEQEWGSVFSVETLRRLLIQHKPAVLCLVMAETSTGALQPLEGVGELCREMDCLFVVDAVTGLCTSPLYVDAWKIDVCYSCSQKGLGCCPGVSPITFSPQAISKIHRRATQVSNWYLDLQLLMQYWSGSRRVYHHTPPVNLLYGLRETLRLATKETLERIWKRHQEAAEYLHEHLVGRGLQLLVKQPAHRCPALTTVLVPKETDPAAVALKLLGEDGVEIGSGIGCLAGKVWRVGLMGVNANKETVNILMRALSKHLKTT